MVNNDNLMSEQDSQQEETRASQPEAAAVQPAPGREDALGFKELYEQSLQNVQLGAVVTGKIVQINADTVMVDVGWKTEGYIPIRELKNDEGNLTIAVGDEIEILVDRRDGDGNLVLSRDKAAKIKVWDDVKKASEQNAAIRGTVVERVKGGLSVDIGITAFLPGSQVDIRPVRDLDRFVGQTLMFNVIKYDRKRNNVVLSRRSILERERGGELPLQHREVALLLRVPRERLRQPRRRLRRAREHHRAPDGAVEPVDEAQVHLPGLMICIPNIAL